MSEAHSRISIDSSTSSWDNRSTTESGADENIPTAKTLLIRGSLASLTGFAGIVGGKAGLNRLAKPLNSQSPSNILRAPDSSDILIKFFWVSCAWLTIMMGICLVPFGARAARDAWREMREASSHSNGNDEILLASNPVDASFIEEIRVVERQ